MAYALLDKRRVGTRRADEAAGFIDTRRISATCRQGMRNSYMRADVNHVRVSGVCPTATASRFAPE